MEFYIGVKSGILFLVFFFYQNCFPFRRPMTNMPAARVAATLIS